MIRLLGGILVGAGCLGLGCWYRQQFGLRIHHLRCMSSILEMMMSEIRYSKATLPECCKRLAERTQEPYSQAFLEIFEYMRENTGEDFAAVFADRMGKVLAAVPVTRQEKELFLEFAQGTGYEEGRMQLRSIEQHKDMLADIITRLEQEAVKQGKMAVSLGAMSGLLLIIILL